jgi:hypothetical protein
MNTKVFFEELELRVQYAVPAHATVSTVPWRAVGLLTAFGVSAIVWLGVLSVIG